MFRTKIKYNEHHSEYVPFGLFLPASGQLSVSYQSNLVPISGLHSLLV